MSDLVSISRYGQRTTYLKIHHNDFKRVFFSFDKISVLAGKETTALQPDRSGKSPGPRLEQTHMHLTDSGNLYGVVPRCEQCRDVMHHPRVNGSHPVTSSFIR